MNRSSFTVRGSDCDAGAPMKIPMNVSKPAVAIFRSIVAFRDQPPSRRPHYRPAGSKSERCKSRSRQQMARWKTSILANCVVYGRIGRSGRPRCVQRGGEFLAEFVELAGIDIADRPQVEA